MRGEGYESEVTVLKEMSDSAEEDIYRNAKIFIQINVSFKKVWISIYIFIRNIRVLLISGKYFF